MFSALKSRDADGAVGILSRETKSRDRESAVLGDEDALTGKQVERAQVLERKAAQQGTRARCPPECAASSLRAAGSRGHRRLAPSVLQPHHHPHDADRSRRLRPRAIAFLWPQLGGGFGSAIRVGLVSDVLSEIRAPTASCTGRKAACGSPNTRTVRSRRPVPPTRRTNSPVWKPALRWDSTVVSSRSTRSARTSAAACPSASPLSGSSAPATVRSTTVSVKSVAARPRGMDRFAMSVSADGVLTVDTGTIIQGPPIGTNTTGQEAEGPNCIGQSSH